MTTSPRHWFSLRCFASAGKLTQDVVKNTAVLEVFAFLRSVDTHPDLEPDGSSGGRCCDDCHDFRGAAVQADDLVAFLARQSQAARVLAFLELQRQYAHADQIRAMDAFETFRNDGPRSEQHGALRRPVP